MKKIEKIADVWAGPLSLHLDPEAGELQLIAWRGGRKYPIRTFTLYRHHFVSSPEALRLLEEFVELCGEKVPELA